MRVKTVFQICIKMSLWIESSLLLIIKYIDLLKKDILIIEMFKGVEVYVYKGSGYNHSR